MRPNKPWKLLHDKQNHQQNKRTTYWMGESICKWQEWQGDNIQSIQTSYKTYYQKTNNSIKNVLKIWIDISKQNIQMNNLKDAQYH